MTLTTAQLEKITFGSLYTTEDENGFSTNRYTEEQRAYLKEYRNDFYIKSFASSSSFVDFKTDSKTLKFEYTLSYYCSREYAYFDVYENDTMILHHGSDSKDDFSGEVSVSLSEGEKRVRVYFPNIQRTSIKNFTLDDGASVIPTEKKYRALVLGDSITHGYDARYPSLSYANVMIEELSLNAINQAIGGEVFNAPTLSDKDIWSPDIITVAFGINDWSKHEYERAISDATAYFEKLRAIYKDTPIVYISPLWTSRNPARQPMLPKYIKSFEQIAASHGAYLIRGFDVVPHDNGMFTDGLHPSDLGFSQYAKGVVNGIKKLGILK